MFFQVGGEQLERMLQDLRGGFPVPPGSLLEDAVSGSGQLGLQRPLHHGRPGETRGEAGLQKSRLWPPVGGGRVDRGRTYPRHASIQSEPSWISYEQQDCAQLNFSLLPHFLSYV